MSPKSNLLIILLSLVLAPIAFAQDESSTDLSGIETETTEAPPRPEPPYPGSEDIDPTVPASKPPVSEAPIQTAPPAADTWREKLPVEAKSAPRPGVERPTKTDDGNYYYGTKPSEANSVAKPGVAKPVKKNDEGEFIYDIDDKSTVPAKADRPTVERPIEITAKGDYHYKLETPKSKRTASFRVGVMGPPTIKNDQTSFASIYGERYQPVLLGDYEWRLTSSVGRLGVKFTSGIFVASGKGVFARPQREGTQAQEQLNFFMFPNQATVIYRFQYADRQLLVPWVEGGGAYYTMAEIRDDAKPPKFAGGLGLVGAGGINILLDWADRRGVQRLSNEYGIHHVWLTAEGRVTVGAVSEVNITNQSYTAGVLFDF